MGIDVYTLDYRAGQPLPRTGGLGQGFGNIRLSGQVQGAAISVAHRISSDLKLNLRWHVLLADGVWTEQDGHATLHPAAPLDTLRVQETPVPVCAPLVRRRGAAHR